MEKKRNQVARNGQPSSDFKTKNQDASNKFPRQRRRESYQTENVNKQQSSGKNRSNNFYYDKRPQARKGGSGLGLDQQVGGATGEASGLMDPTDELNSVFNHGSKKQNLNHLLNFHYYNANESEIARGGTFSKHGYHQHRPSKRYNFNKEQYLQANCQFVVKSDLAYDYRQFSISPDALVEWDQVVKILVSSSEESQCPICLYPPKAAKMTRCGHIFCYACMLHYLSLSDKNWRKCPICYESVHLHDLKSASSKQSHSSYKIGDTITMELMTREKGSLYVTMANKVRSSNARLFPNFSDGEVNFQYSKLIMADPLVQLKIIDQERNELEFQLIEDGEDCPESIFVQQAMELLNIKKSELKKALMELTVVGEMSLGLNHAAAEFIPVQHHEDIGEDLMDSHEKRHELIDEECNLTVNDIDIVPVALNSQSKYFYYYQAPNAQNVFLHSVNSRMLQKMYDSLDKSPQKIQGKIVQIECCSMNEDLRKRLKYLQHLPVSSVFEVVEVEFDLGIVSLDVIDLFKDELLHRRKIRQKREREERKREKVINEINDRSMGKMMRSSANINIASQQQFPECGSFSEMPALSSGSDCSSSPIPSSSSAGPSFATMLTTSKARKSEKAWPILENGDKTPRSSFFDDKNLKLIHVTGNKSMMATPQPKTASDDDDVIEDEGADCKVPVYKNQLGDCLANALAKSVSLKDAPKSNGKKKKAKKTLLFASGMNFN